MMQFWLKSPLFDATTDGGTAGGGAGTANPGLTKDDVAAIVANVFNGMDKRYTKQFKDFETSLKGLDGIAKAFGGVKPKKLAKLLAKAGGKDANDEEDDTANNGGGGNGGNSGGDNNTDANRNKQQNKVLDDPFKKRKFRELLDRVAAVEKERDEAKKAAENSLIDQKVEAVLNNFVWASPKARGSAFKELRPMVERDADGDLVVGDAKYDSFMMAKIPEDFEYLLAPKLKFGSGVIKGVKGGKGFDLDSLGPDSKPDEIREAARAIAEALAAGG